MLDKDVTKDPKTTSLQVRQVYEMIDAATGGKGANVKHGLED